MWFRVVEAQFRAGVPELLHLGFLRLSESLIVFVDLCHPLGNIAHIFRYLELQAQRLDTGIFCF